tara:strand:+ start:775 stop:1017 length:243 start_codon:yes stop_codon:yes gene_type:complete
MKHWARNLPEAGKLVQYKVERFEKLSLEIEDLKKEIASLEKERRNEESEILSFVSDDWTKEEIEKARTSNNTDSSFFVAD